MEFTGFLKTKDISEKTVAGHLWFWEKVVLWCRSTGLNEDFMTYNDIMAFVKYCHLRYMSGLLINRYLCTIRYYYDYLYLNGINRTPNPATGIVIRGTVQKQPHNLMNTVEMEELFKIYSLQTVVQLSKKVMLGLMIHQGMTTTQISALREHHIKMAEGKILITGSYYNNARIMPIHPQLIPVLYRYLQSNIPGDGIFIKNAKAMRPEGQSYERQQKKSSRIFSHI